MLFKDLKMIPSFTLSGALPPFTGDNPTSKASMSPYETSMSSIVQRFGTSAERLEIPVGLIRYRQALRDFGFTAGFQWIDGSFVEDVERTRNRAPQDIDLVTFARLTGVSQAELKIKVQQNQGLFLPKETRRQYQCDAYLVQLDKEASLLVDDTRYWFGLFSHQRTTSLWKGMLKLDLQSDDTQALQLLKGAA